MKGCSCATIDGPKVQRLSDGAIVNAPAAGAKSTTVLAAQLEVPLGPSSIVVTEHAKQPEKFNRLLQARR
jgi:hypothetical protein